jgi:hypothetical protein
VIKRVIRGALRRASAWLRESEPSPPRDFSKDTNAYPWLAAKYLEVEADPECGIRPAYIWGVLNGAHLARALGIPRISVTEFGVAGGNGLVALDRISARVEQIYGIQIDVFGFDTGSGLPAPLDHRDSPNLYSEGYFPMDREKLEKRLNKARLILGPIADTISSFLASRPAPIAFISVDVDYYTSTVQTLRALEAEHSALLPRIQMYFDDIMGFTWSDYNGERLAIAEFNAAHTSRKISPIYGLKWFLPPGRREAIWAEQFFLAHIFDHPLIGKYDGLGKWTTELGNLSLR